ncbi:hypothetical protein Tco_0336519 [Tanacetum coccineum]
MIQISSNQQYLCCDECGRSMRLSNVSRYCTIGTINTTLETETISVETLVSNPSESDDFSLGECNLFDIDDSFYEKSTSRLAHLAPLSPEIVEACVDDDDTYDDDYDDDFYDCVDIEEEGGEIDLDISKIVDISLREKLVKSYLLIEKINAFSLSPPIPISPIICPSLLPGCGILDFNLAKSPSNELVDVGSKKDFHLPVNTKEYHSDLERTGQPFHIIDLGMRMPIEIVDSPWRNDNKEFFERILSEALGGLGALHTLRP